MNVFLHLIYLPLIKLLQLLLFWLPQVRSRSAFEAKNKSEAGTQSFRQDSLKADICFEFSSEGEYQQVASLIDDALKEGKRLELVFFSPSVEKAIIDLYQKYPDQIRYLRYPVLSLAFTSWITSSQLVMVRYDLFPEFLAWSLKRENKLKFLWVTFKKERVKGRGISLFKRTFLNQARFILFASDADRALGAQLGLTGMSYDFRMEQIRRRILSKAEKFERIFPLYGRLMAKVESYPRHQRLLIGNAWPSDLFLFKHLPSDVFALVVPHQLKPEILSSMMEGLTEQGRTVQLVDDSFTGDIFANTVILNKKGVLCELYADFGKSYVGGGFEASIHSILEPLVAGSESIACGPKHERSTEYDLGVSFGRVKEVKSALDFQNWLSEVPADGVGYAKLKTQIDSYGQFAKDLWSC